MNWFSKLPLFYLEFHCILHRTWLAWNWRNIILNLIVMCVVPLCTIVIKKFLKHLQQTNKDQQIWTFFVIQYIFLPFIKFVFFCFDIVIIHCHWSCKGIKMQIRIIFAKIFRSVEACKETNNFQSFSVSSFDWVSL
jgi:hypothetical protein